MKREVQTEFTATDKGYSAAVSRISSAFQGGAKHLGHFNEKLGDYRRESNLTTAATIGVGIGLGAWIEKAKEANAEFNRTQKGVAGLLAGSLAFEAGASEIDRYNRSLELSKDITEKLDETGARFNMQLDEVAQTYRTTTAAVSGLGLKQQEVMELTEGATATAKRFGAGGEQAAKTIARALQTGAVKGYDDFSISLRRALGDMKKLTQAQRFEHIQKALKGSMQIADAMSDDIGGALGRIQNVVEDLLRDATGPVFKEIASTLGGWAKSMREVKASGESVTKSIGDKLVSGFKTLQSVSGFIKDHWVSIAAVFASIKAGSLAQSLAGQLGGLGASIGGNLGGGIGGLGSALGQMAGKILPVVGALAVFKTALDGVTDFVNKKIEKSMDREVTAHGVAGTLGIVSKLANLGVMTDKQTAIAKRQVEELKKSGVISAGGDLDQGGLAAQLDAMTYAKKQELAKALDLSWDFLAGESEQAAQELAGKLGGFVKRFAMPAVTAPDDKSLKFAKQVVNFNGDISISQKFEDQDPDRVFVRFKQDLLREAGSRTQSLAAEPQGD